VLDGERPVSLEMTGARREGERATGSAARVLVLLLVLVRVAVRPATAGVIMTGA
jgi:hypothetical protein